MTHPPSGPDTGGPPPGPKLTEPMSWERRIDIYVAQNGTDRLTRRQYKRLTKKGRHAAVRRFGLDAS